MDQPQAQCSAGTFTGNFQNNLNIFYGIPYAKPLEADTQWLPPEPLEDPICLDAIKRGYTAPQTIYEKSFFHDPSLPEESIDCLTLNIASKNLKAKMPVMVWIHGGAYVTGSANSSIYDLFNLPQYDVVLVTVNYRLGPFGFLKLNKVTNGKISSTGNEGLMDQKLAIEWVKKNIDTFGGDPDNITLFGESAGAWSVALQSSIHSDGNLFSKAICQSGGMNAYIDENRANSWGDLFLQQADQNGISVNDLQKCPVSDIVSLAIKMKHTMISEGKWLSPEIGFSPVADGNFLPIDPLKNFKHSPIRLIVGTTSDEYRLWSEFEAYYLNLTEEQFLKRLKKIFHHEKISSIKKQYLDHSLNDDKYKQALSNIMTDWTFGIHALKLLENHKNKSFGYLFNEASPLFGGRLGAYHASELPYLFGSWKKEPLKSLCSKNAEKTSEILQVLWTQFAKSGVPSFKSTSLKPFSENKILACINSSLELKTHNKIKKLTLLHESKINY